MKKIVIYISAIIVIGGLILGLIWWSKNQTDQKNNTDPSLNNVKKSGKLVVGVDFSYGVMEFYDSNNKAVGIDIDLAKEIASRLGVKAEIKEFDWENLFPMIENKEVDLVLSSVTITQERSTKALFSTPYFNGGQVILTKTDNKDINTIDDLKNRKIGVQVDTVSEEQAKKITTANLVTTYASWENPEDKGKIIYDLKNGKTDAVIVDYIQAVDSVEKDAEVKIVGSPFTQEFYGAVTNLDNKTLMNAVDNVLRDIKKEGVLKNIEDKWTKS